MTNMRTTNIEYNINGIGVINPFVYDYTNSLLNEKSLGIEAKMKSISQLGAIKYLHQGAHYTRYEYLLLQFTLVHFIKDNSSLALSQKLNIQDLEDGFQIEKMKDITRGDYIELIALLGNIGHFKDTFSSNKVWFHFLCRQK